MSTVGKQQAAKSEKPRQEAAPLGEAPATVLADGVSVAEALDQRATEIEKQIELGLVETPADDADPATRPMIPKVFATPCPTNPAHTKTQVYSTKGRERFCKCNDCGATWKQTGPEAEPRSPRAT